MIKTTQTYIPKCSFVKVIFISIVFLHLSFWKLFFLFLLFTSQVLLSFSYETVAAILQPSSSGSVTDADTSDPLDSLSSSVSPKDSPTGSDHSLEELVQAAESEVFDSAEPYMWRLVGGSETSLSSKETESWFVEDEEFCLMRKWPPLTEEELHEITRDEEDKTDIGSLIQECTSSVQEETGNVEIVTKSKMLKDELSTTLFPEEG